MNTYVGRMIFVELLKIPPHKFSTTPLNINAGMEKQYCDDVSAPYPDIRLSKFLDNCKNLFKPFVPSPPNMDSLEQFSIFQTPDLRCLPPGVIKTMSFS